MTKLLYILTGPPGSGKTTYASKEFPLLKVFDTDLGNKELWRLYIADCILMTSAPSAGNKDYWCVQAEFNGFTPILHCIWVDRMVAYARMEQRSGLHPTERNNLATSVERWYKLYTRHQKEIRHG